MIIISSSISSWSFVFNYHHFNCNKVITSKEHFVLVVESNISQHSLIGKNHNKSTLIKTQLFAFHAATGLHDGHFTNFCVWHSTCYGFEAYRTDLGRYMARKSEHNWYLPRKCAAHLIIATQLGICLGSEVMPVKTNPFSSSRMMKKWRFITDVKWSPSWTLSDT